MHEYFYKNSTSCRFRWLVAQIVVIRFIREVLVVVIPLVVFPMLLHIKKRYFIHFCCLFLKSSKAFSVSLSKIYFSVDCFVADFLQFSSATVRICLLDGWLITRLKFQTFQGFPWNFLNSLNPKCEVVWHFVP